MTTASASVPAVRLRGLAKSFGAVHAVRGVDLDIADGEFLCMLGPSGSGKTTVLRMIAGFEAPTAGSIELGGRDVTGAPPFDRDVNTVFQDYALFPHLTAAKNVEYGLRVKGVARRPRRDRAEEALAAVSMAGFGDRKPSQLSGGQRQRVALARALVNRPRVLLLDEPLGALDLKLRQQMQIELKRIQREVGITFVFVTHDQDEALTMSDRIVVFDGGRVEQLGPPWEIYEHPATRFVATFVGTANIVEGAAAQALSGSDRGFAVRPERIQVRDGETAVPPGWMGSTGTVTEVTYAGSHLRLVVATRAGATLAVAPAEAPTGPDQLTTFRGRTVTVCWPADAARIWPDHESATRPSAKEISR